jgi:hypothetical protein
LTRSRASLRAHARPAAVVCCCRGSGPPGALLARAPSHARPTPGPPPPSGPPPRRPWPRTGKTSRQWCHVRSLGSSGPSSSSSPARAPPPPRAAPQTPRAAHAAAARAWRGARARGKPGRVFLFAVSPMCPE